MLSEQCILYVLQKQSHEKHLPGRQVRSGILNLHFKDLLCEYSVYLHANKFSKEKNTVAI